MTLVAIDHEIVKHLMEVLEATRAELERIRTHASVGNDDPIGLKEASAYLNLSRSSMYQNLDKIPHRKRHGRLYFFKSELRRYLEAGTV